MDILEKLNEKLKPLHKPQVQAEINNLHDVYYRMMDNVIYIDDVVKSLEKLIKHQKAGDTDILTKGTGFDFNKELKIFKRFQKEVKKMSKESIILGNIL
jgi:SHS2 domain-containing protein